MLKRILLFFLLLNSFLMAQNYELQSIEFNGNSEISSSELSDIIYSKETPWWFWKFLNSFTSFGAEPIYFDSANIPLDLDALEAYYNSNGFFESQFSYDFTVDTSESEITLTYYITEGDAATYRKFDISGIEKTPPQVQQEIWEEILTDTTERYNQTIIEQKIDESVSTLLNSGYMLARFDSTIILRDTIENKADIFVHFSTGEKYYIDTILIEKSGEGANLVNERLLREIVAISPGEAYNLEKIRLSQVRLFRTGLFNSVQLNGNSQDTVGNRVPLKLTGNIGLLNELSPEIVINDQNDFNLGLGANYIRKNFLGDARKLTVRFSFGLQDFFGTDFGQLIKKFSFRDTTLLGYVDGRIIIEQPNLFNKPIYGIWENYASIDKQNRFNVTAYGSKITFDFELPRYTLVNSLSTSYNLEQTHEVYRTHNDSLSSKLLSIIGIDMGRTTADNILFPTRGYNLSVRLEEANSLPYLVTKLYGDDYSGAMFYKVLVSSSFYWALDSKQNSIAAFKLKSGHLQTYFGDYAGIPINRTFYAGGSNSVRGWRANQLVPEGTPTIEGIIPLAVNVKGGTFLLEGSIEYRLRFLENFGTALFFDFGNTWLGYQKFRYDQIALAAGIGFRYYTEVAPFRIDFGFKFYDPSNRKYIWDREAFKTMEFHFGIGEAF